MNEPRDNVAGIAMSPTDALALKEGRTTLAQLLDWEPPVLPVGEIPILADPRMQPGDVALYGPDQWRRRLLGQQLWERDQAGWPGVRGKHDGPREGHREMDPSQSRHAHREDN